MTPQSIAQVCAALGFSLQVKEDRLQVIAPTGAVSPGLLANIRQHKMQLIQLLKGQADEHVYHPHTHDIDDKHDKDDKDDKDDKHSELVGYSEDETYLSCLSSLSSESCVFDDKHADYEERAAIMEYCGGLSREQAEREAQRLTGWKIEGSEVAK
jgi:hypothetical protein